MNSFIFEHYLGIGKVYILAENEGRAYQVLAKWYNISNYFIAN